jgi:hypothetical protein
MYELLILVPAVIGMAGAVTTGQWWFEAHTRWLARLSARGLIESHVEPWEPPRRLIDNLNPRWMSRQRIAGHDLARLSHLRHTADEDRTTEMWRLRALRRSRLALWVGLAWLASTCAYPAAYGVAGAESSSPRQCFWSPTSCGGESCTRVCAAGASTTPSRRNNRACPSGCTAERRPSPTAGVSGAGNGGGDVNGRPALSLMRVQDDASDCSSAAGESECDLAGRTVVEGLPSTLAGRD